MRRENFELTWLGSTDFFRKNTEAAVGDGTQPQLGFDGKDVLAVVAADRRPQEPRVPAKAACKRRPGARRGREREHAYSATIFMSVLILSPRVEGVSRPSKSISRLVSRCISSSSNCGTEAKVGRFSPPPPPLSLSLSLYVSISVSLSCARAVGTAAPVPAGARTRRAASPS